MVKRRPIMGTAPVATSPTPTAPARLAAIGAMVVLSCGGEGKPDRSQESSVVGAGSASAATQVVPSTVDAAAQVSVPWFCFRDPAQRIGVCFPGVELCDVARDSYLWLVGKKAAPGSCAPQPEAFCAVIDGGGVSCAPVREDCTAVRDTYVAAGARVASCNAVKAWDPSWQDLKVLEQGLRERPPHDALRPRGSGWYCTEFVGAWASAGAPLRTVCFREASRCKELRDSVGGKGCKGKESLATCITSSQDYFCARDMTGCRELRESIKDEAGEVLSDCGVWR